MRLTACRFWIACCLCVLGLTSTVLPAQEPQRRPIFRADVELVQLDVIVLGADGRPVRGLTRDDFTLMDAGVPRPVETVAEFSHIRPPETGLPADLPRDVADNRDAATDRLVMIVLDDLHFRDRTGEVRGIVRRVVAELGAGASIGLVTTSGTFGVEVTEDRAQVIREVDAFFDRFDFGKGARGPVTVDTATLSVGSPGVGVSMSDAGGGPRPRGPSDPGRFFGGLHGYKTVEDVARMVGANDGRRKVFVWVAAAVPGAGLAGAALRGYRNDAQGRDRCDGDPWTCMSLNAMFEKLRQSGVTVHAINPGGATDFGGSLASIAAETGGLSVPANDLETGLMRLVEDLDNYYLIGFRPDRTRPRPDRGFASVEVRVNRPGVTVRHRAGYAVDGPPPPPRNRDPLGALVAPVMPARDLPLRIGATTFLTNGNDSDVLVTIDAELGALPPPGPDGLVRDRVELGVFAVDLRRKRVTKAQSKWVEVEWPLDEQGTPTGAPRLRLQTVLRLPTGRYQIRASAIARRLELSGSVYLQTDVPAPKDERLAIGGLAVTPVTVGGSEPRVVLGATPRGRTLPFPPSLARGFDTGDRLRVLFDVRAPAATEGRLLLVDRDDREVRTVAWRVAERGVRMVELDLPLDGLAAGAYRLRADAQVGHAVAVREIPITIGRGTGR